MTGGSSSVTSCETRIDDVRPILSEAGLEARTDFWSSFVRLLAHSDLTFEGYRKVCAQIVRRKTNAFAPTSVLAVIARRDIQKGWDWSTGLAQAERVAQRMRPEERVNPLQMEAKRRAELATHCRLQQDRVDRILRHYDEVRELARAFQRASFRKRLHLLLADDPLFRWLRLRFERTGHSKRGNG